MTIDQPRFDMFERIPEVDGSASLISSMQTFESSLFLVSLGRYPHALSMAVFAIESALKAKWPENSDKTLHKLLEAAHRESKSVAVITMSQINALRITRNRIVHSGFSPPDDSVSASLLLDVAVPMFVGVYADFFAFDVYEGLLPGIGNQLRTAVDTSAQKRNADPSDGTCMLVVLAHLIRVRIQQALTPGATEEAVESASAVGRLYEQIQRRRAGLERVLYPSWATTCPACDCADSFICALDDNALHEGQLVLVRGTCAECDLAVPRESAALLNAIFAQNIDQARIEILGEFGIAPRDV